MAVDFVQLSDGRAVKLGRRRPKQVIRLPGFVVSIYDDGRVRVTPELSRYYDSEKDTTPPPAVVDWTPKGMDSIKHVYLNDQYGDCVIASKYHMEGVASGNESGAAVVASDQEVLNSYHTICGPGDNGCIISDVLDYWQKNGLVFSGQTKQIDGYVAVDWTNQLMVQVALEVFGNLCLGINLPSGWQCTNCVWGPSGGMVGGHDVPAFGYGATLSDATGKPFNQDGVVIATWGGLCLIPWAQFCSKDYIEEAYVALLPDWYANANLAPNGIDAATLRSDLQQLGGGVIPDPSPVLIDFSNL